MTVEVYVVDDGGSDHGRGRHSRRVFAASHRYNPFTVGEESPSYSTLYVGSLYARTSDTKERSNGSKRRRAPSFYISSTGHYTAYDSLSKLYAPKSRLVFESAGETGKSVMLVKTLATPFLVIIFERGARPSCNGKSRRWKKEVEKGGKEKEVAVKEDEEEDEDEEEVEEEVEEEENEEEEQYK
ncbi:hypothetical protein HZH68_010654 [Vespula germanica]|uniref:Uncharacterized protein n=1 Tax=Vespula germanica TaxID=30212 RepID=A0A834JTG8_VESGE|nr:hypothetical protein HZH68_010654 [Vespula germanica]